MMLADVQTDWRADFDCHKHFAFENTCNGESYLIKRIRPILMKEEDESAQKVNYPVIWHKSCLRISRWTSVGQTQQIRLS